jgi:hypothetical protein
MGLPRALVLSNTSPLARALQPQGESQLAVSSNQSGTVGGRNRAASTCRCRCDAVVTAIAGTDQLQHCFCPDCLQAAAAVSKLRL